MTVEAQKAIVKATGPQKPRATTGKAVLGKSNARVHSA